MRRIATLYLIFNIFMFSGKAVLALPASCQIKNEKIIPNLPPARSQDGVGLCYGFAATQLLQFHYCKNKPGGCNFKLNAQGTAAPSSDLISALDVIRLGSNGEIRPEGSTASVLGRVQNIKIPQTQIAKEACAPFDTLTQRGLSEFKNSAAWYDVAVLGSKSWYKLNSENKIAAELQKCEIKRRLEILFPNSDNLNNIIDGLLYDPHRYLAELAIPANKCLSDKIIIAPYKSRIWPQKNDKAEQYQPKLKSLLDANIPTGVSFCYEYEDNNPLACKMSHAAVAIGHREVCCPNSHGENICTEQTKLLDSSFPRFDADFIKGTSAEIDKRNPNHRLHGWIDSIDLNKRAMSRLQGKVEALTWIE